MVDSLPKENYLDWTNADKGLKFGSRYIDGAGAFSKFLWKFIAKNNNLGSIFAYDVLIRNCDRTQNKPNLLLVDNTIYLIDHELCFDIDEKYLSNIQTFNFEAYPFSKAYFLQRA